MQLNTASARLNVSTLGLLGVNRRVSLAASSQCVAQTSGVTIRVLVAVLHSTTVCSASSVTTLSVKRTLARAFTAQADTSGCVLRQAVPNGLMPINIRAQASSAAFLRVKIPLTCSCTCAMDSTAAISQFARVRIPIAGTASSISNAFLRRKFNIAISGTASAYSIARLRHKVNTGPGALQCSAVCTAKIHKTNNDYAPQGRAFMVDGSPRVFIVRNN